MAIISLDREMAVDFIPEYGGNRDSDTPCIVRLKFVPYSRIQHYSRLIAARTKSATDPAKVTEVSQEIQRRQFVDSVESITGYYIGEREIKDPGEFYDSADTDLILEIIRAMESSSKLTEGQRKN